MSRFVLSPGMADFLAQYRGPRWDGQESRPDYYSPPADGDSLAAAGSYLPPVQRETLAAPSPAIDYGDNPYGMTYNGPDSVIGPGETMYPDVGSQLNRNVNRRLGNPQPDRLKLMDQMFGFAPLAPPSTGFSGGAFQGEPADERLAQMQSWANRVATNEAVAGPAALMQMFPGAMTRRPADQPLLPAPPSPIPEPMVGPAPQERAPWQSTITTGSGVVTTAYPQIGDGQYGTGQVVSDTRPTGPKSIQEMFRDRFNELRRDQSYGLFGMPATAAAGIANTEMQPLIAQQEFAARAAEGDANRQMQMALERSRIEAGKYDRQQQLQSDIAKAGINAAGSGQLGPFLRDMAAFNSATGGRLFGSTGLPAGPQAPVDPYAVSPDEKGRRLLQQLAPLLPKTFQYAAPGVGRERSVIQGAAENLDGPAGVGEIFNRMAGAGLDEPAMRSFVETLRSAPGGQQVYERLLSQAFADDIAARNQPTSPRGVLSTLMGLPVVSALTGGGAATYPSQITFEDYPGTTASAVPDKTNIDRLGRIWRSGGVPNYTLTTPSGMTLPLPVRDSLGGDMNRVKAQEQMRMLLRQVGLNGR